MKIPHLIVGGGLAGTTMAISFLQKDIDFLILESSSRLGGKVETQLTDEACFEFGPNSFTNQSEEIFRLLEMLDLETDLLEASRASQNRYILREGKLVRLPGKPQDIFTTKSLSVMGRLRFLREFFYVSPKKIEDESVRDFFLRHFGREIADYFADPFVSGIYAGDASQLSLKEAFPTMAAAEESSPSILRYMVLQNKTDKATMQTYQLKEGLGSIFCRAAQHIGEKRIHLSEKVIEIIPGKEMTKVVTDRAEYEADNLYMTAPAYVTAACLKKEAPKLAKVLSNIHYAPVITVHLKISRQESYPFDGFGILIPSSEQRRILGVLWNSSTFPSLFPDKQHHYLTVFVGGAHHDELVRADESVIEDLVCEELQDLFALQERPRVIQMRRHERAIPQYKIGYGKILQSVQKSLASYPSLKLAGNYLGGISMAKTVAYAMQIAEN